MLLNPLRILASTVIRHANLRFSTVNNKKLKSSADCQLDSVQGFRFIRRFNMCNQQDFILTVNR